MCKVSIITPVYKVEEYLDKCVGSILKQTFTDFELIIVDDGSPDACGKIADQYSQKDNRVRVIHKENGGAPSARNAGIEIASGEYYYFPDSDDWLEDTYLQNLVELAEKTQVDLVISGYTMEYNEQGKEQEYIVSVEEKAFLCKIDVRNNLHSYFNNMMMAVPWNKLYRSRYILENNLRFPNLKWDDLHFNMDVIMNIEKVAISSSTGYHFFRSRQGSETTTVFDGLLYKKRKEQFEHVLMVYKYWDIRDSKIMSIIYGYYAARLVQCVQEIAVSNQANKRELLSEILNDNLAKEAFKKGRINSVPLFIAAVPMKLGSIDGSIIIGKMIGFYKEHWTSSFYQLKSKSVNKAKVKK